MVWSYDVIRPSHLERLEHCIYTLNQRTDWFLLQINTMNVLDPDRNSCPYSSYLSSENIYSRISNIKSLESEKNIDMIFFT